jgi:hypothetical protein
MVSGLQIAALSHRLAQIETTLPKKKPGKERR